MDATHLKIISLEHQVAVLTTAVTMLLDMKADAEKYALERAKQYIEEIPTWPSWKTTNTPPRRVFFATYDSGYSRPNGKGSNRVEDFIDAAAELKTNADKTDRLLSELTKPATVISQATPVTEPVIVEDTTPSKTLVASSKEYIRITPTAYIPSNNPTE